MTVGRYAPGSRQAVVTDRGVVVLGSDVPVSMLERVWTHAGEGRGLPAVLEALTGAFGTSLAAIPPFAVVLREDDGVRAVVRGGLEITVETATGLETLSGAGVTTWTERIVPGALRVTIGTPDAGPAEYPVRDGIVLVSAVTLALADAVTPAPGPAPAPEPTPAPEPAPVAEPVEAPEFPVAERAERDEALPAGPSTGSGTEDAAPIAEPVEVPATPVAEPVEAPAPPAPAPAVTGLIDSAAVLTMTGADTLLPGDSTFARAAAPDLEVLDATIARPVASGPLAGDHDGETISVAEARALRGVTGDSAPPPLAPPRPPALARIRLSTGQELLLDRTVVIGRRPRSTRLAGTDLPHLVAVESPEQDISRSHVELRAEGDSVVATDLHTTNGTTLHRAGADPVRLHPGEATVVVTGDVLDLGDGVTVAIEAPA